MKNVLENLSKNLEKIKEKKDAKEKKIKEALEKQAKQQKLEQIEKAEAQAKLKKKLAEKLENVVDKIGDSIIENTAEPIIENTAEPIIENTPLIEDKIESKKDESYLVEGLDFGATKKPKEPNLEVHESLKDILTPAQIAALNSGITEADVESISGKADKTEIPSVRTIQTSLAAAMSMADGGADPVAHGGGDIDLSNYYDKPETDSLLSQKADKSSLNSKADSSSVYKKDEVDAKLNTKVNIDDVYNKTQMDSKLSTKVENTELSDYFKKSVDNSILGNTLFTGTVSVPEPMADTNAVTKKYIDAIVPAVEYAENTAYKRGQLIKSGSKVFVVTGDFTSTTWAADESTLTLLNKDNLGIAEYAAGVEIQNGQTVLYDGKLYVSKATLTATTWDSDSSKMVAMSSVDLTEYYKKTEVYNKAEVDTELAKKADADKVYTKEEVETLHNDTLNKISDKATLADIQATKTIIDADLAAAIKKGQDENAALEISLKAEIPTLAEEAAKNVAYTKAETNQKLLLKVDKTTLDSYTNTADLNDALAKKLDKTTIDDYYTKTQVDAQHNTLVSDIYNKSEVNALLGTKVDTTTLTANYTTSADLKQLLLAKADKTALETHKENHNNDIIKLTTAMQEVSDELTATVTKLTETANKVTEIVPTDASATNQLTSKEYVDNAVKTAAARAISADADGAGFASLDALKTGPWYSLGESTTPTTNDYAVVKKDASHNNNDVRYNYDGAVWVFFQEFTSGGSGGSVSFTTAQQKAIDSGITSEKVTQIQTNTNNITAEETARIKGDADLAADIEKRVKEASNKIGDITSLNTDVKTSIVECINDLHTELHNERLATDGTNQMTAELKITLPGSGDLIELNAGDKGVNFNLDASTGYMSIIPVSAPTTGFELSAVSIKPRTSDYPYSLGDNNNPFKNGYFTNINNTPVSDFLTTADMTKAELQQIKTDIETNKTNIDTKVNKAGDEMTGTLKVTLPGSGDLIHMEGGGKGVTFTMDATTGFMHIIPVSAPTTGFEVSAVALEPRTTTLPYRLGNDGNQWHTVWAKNINNIAVTDFAQKSDLDALKYFATNTTGAITFTQAEYDALTDEEKNNGKLYIIVG